MVLKGAWMLDETASMDLCERASGDDGEQVRRVGERVRAPQKRAWIIYSHITIYLHSSFPIYASCTSCGEIAQL
jgi:hypothetical protein